MSCDVISGHGGQPGKWTQLGKGPTSVANNVEVVVLSGQSLAADEVPVFHYGMKTTPTASQDHARIKAADVVAGTCTGIARKLVTTGKWDFIIKHNDGAARDFDWVVYKVTPA